MAGVSVEVDDRQVLAALGELIARVEDTRPVFEDIGEYLLRAHDDRFQSQRAPDGTPWQPLSPAYQARKKRNADKILQLEGNLRDLSYDASRDGVVLGTNRIYGATHQFGRPEAGIPPRPFLGVSDDDRAEILDIVRDSLRDAIRR